METEVLTNAGRIRAMTDEELAKWFAPHMCCSVCDRDKMDCLSGCNLDECEKYALAYMKREVSEYADD